MDNIIEERVDIRDHEPSPEEIAENTRRTQLLFEVNHTDPTTDRYSDLIGELFGSMGEGCRVVAPLQGVCFDRIHVGRNVFINSNLLAMARGGIEIADDVQIAANVQILTNNHDPYDRAVLLCKPVTIGRGAWIGAGATILPGVSIGAHAIVGAASVVTHDVADFEVVAGNPARNIRFLDAERWADEEAE